MSKTHRPSATGNSAQRDAIVSCWMCGIRRPASQMVPDGGNACDDIRWYCLDARACTGRWTTSRHALAQTDPGKQGAANDAVTSATCPPDPVDAATSGAALGGAVIIGT
jgi:hypothetical protein